MVVLIAVSETAPPNLRLAADIPCPALSTVWAVLWCWIQSAPGAVAVELALLWKRSLLRNLPPGVELTAALQMAP
jgi:hypothetical protein